VTRERVAVLDHGMGNLHSVAKALEAAGGRVSVTSGAAGINRCDALCVPGQGVFGRCMSNLRNLGLDKLIEDWIASNKPYLGICLGMQVLFDHSEEGGGLEGLGVFRGPVRRLSNGIRIPHIGWNSLGEDYFYFDHSYAAFPRDEGIVDAWCDHGGRWAAAVRRDSILGVQFHPEKSGRAGIALLTQWLGGEG
jgi:imidazole glycerol phosphate synthase glutamine amidotransferase subunit